MKNKKILDEIMANAEQIPLECQERILDIVKGMAFTNKCLIHNPAINRREEAKSNG